MKLTADGKLQPEMLRSYYSGLIREKVKYLSGLRRDASSCDVPTVYSQQVERTFSPCGLPFISKLSVKVSYVSE